MSDQIVYGFIADGYTLEHTIPALSGFHPELNIKFRPTTPVERVTTSREIANLDRADRCGEAERKAAEFMAKKLVSWDLMAPPNTEGAMPQTVEINTANILRLEHHLSASLFKVLLGEDPAVRKESEGDTKN